MAATVATTVVLREWADRCTALGTVPVILERILRLPEEVRPGRMSGTR